MNEIQSLFKKAEWFKGMKNPDIANMGMMDSLKNVHIPKKCTPAKKIFSRRLN